MPVYEYICSECNEDFSFLKMSRTAEEPVCPSCGSREVVKKLSSFSFGPGYTFSGGGGG